MSVLFRALGLMGVLVISGVAARGEAPKSKAPTAASQVVRVLALGDSITKGERAGVRAEETFAAIAEKALKSDGLAVEVVNLGVGGERTDQFLKRLDEATAGRPRVATVMYGTNDSYVDQGSTASRISVEQYEANLRSIVSALLLRGVEPILMTAPRWADGATADGQGANPNVKLAPYMAACRKVAVDCRVPLVDHFARWTEAGAKGQALGEWTTDGCHPNPRGHRELADALLPALRAVVRSSTRLVPFTTRLDTVFTHDDRTFLWYHPRAAAVPAASGGGLPTAVMTLQKHLSTSDHYSGMSVLTGAELGRTWDGPKAIAELDWVHEPEGVDVAVADVTPMYHPKTGKVVAVGAQVRYSPKGEQLEDRPRSNQTAYSVFDPKSGRWTPWRRLEMPASEEFNLARSACAQFVVEDDGTLLLPFYIAKSSSVPAVVTVARCTFDGDGLTYREHGDVLSLKVDRGLYEPSLVRSGGVYYMTIRNDEKGYVTTSGDGLHFRPVKPWTFDDGEDLGSYNTQQHWLAHGDGLFLVYTRRGANNDHIALHRAPLFIAQVDRDRLNVIRATERVLIPERGGEFGNFGASAMTDRESWVTVCEGVWNEDARRRGAKGALYVARMLWGEESASPPSR